MLERALILMRQHPLFANWTEKYLLEFYSLGIRKKYNQDKIIVNQGDLIDAIYLILKGKAEVTVAVESANPSSVAILEEGEMIGISNNEFFSKTGARTATVTTITTTELLIIDIEHFHDFFSRYPFLNPAIQKTSTDILKMALIKRARPFAKLSLLQINQLMHKIREKNISEDSIIFNQGEEGDYCYLIYSGVVEISRKENGQKIILADLVSPQIFGEAALLMSKPRNATAKAKTNTTLLAIHRDDLLELVAQEEKLAEELSAVILEHARPLPIKNIISSVRRTVDNEEIVTLKEPEKYNFFQLTAPGWYIWKKMNGRRTVREITLVTHKKFPDTTSADVINLLFELAQVGFIEIKDYKLPKDIRHLPWWQKIVVMMQKVLEARYSFGAVDFWITKTFESTVKWFYLPVIRLLFLAIGIMGLLFFFLFSSEARVILAHTHQLISLIIVIDVVTILTVSLHELGHAYTTKYYGREVHHFGFGWYWITPIAFTDTSDMWLGSRKERMAVDIAGIFVDFVIAGLSSIGAWFASSSIIAIFFWLFALFAYIDIFYNFNPLIELDGYYLLMDFFEKENLREDSVHWLTAIFPNEWYKLKHYKFYWKEIAYWLICVLFILTSACLAWFMQHVIFSFWLTKDTKTFWNWLVPLLVIFLSFLGIYVDIKRRQMTAE